MERLKMFQETRSFHSLELHLHLGLSSSSVPRKAPWMPLAGGSRRCPQDELVASGVYGGTQPMTLVIDPCRRSGMMIVPWSRKTPMNAS